MRTCFCCCLSMLCLAFASAASGASSAPTTAGGASAGPTVAGTQAPAAAGAQTPPAQQARMPAPRVAVFFETGFPAIDTAAPDLAALRASLTTFDLSVLDSAALVAALDASRVDVLVLPFGSAFPQAAWPSIFRFLSAGGKLVNLGGVPFAVPVVRENDGWRNASRTTSYDKQLGVLQAFPVDTSAMTFRATDADDPLSVALAADARPSKVFELFVRFTTTKSFPDEDGSDGPREASLTPLVHAFGPGALPLAAPVLLIDRLKGQFAGGRWIFVTGDRPIAPRSVAALVTRAALGALEFTVRPQYAGFHPGEPIAVTASLRRPGAAPISGLAASIEVYDTSGRAVGAASEPLQVSGDSAIAQVIVPVNAAATGLCRIVATVTRPGVRESHSPIKASSGFWIYDHATIAGGRAIAAGRDYFTRDGKPFPIAGTTYMATDVHRRFLLEPNAWVWERDFAAMAAAGVNMVRTGIWTAWSLHSDADGRPTEAALRALEVFLLTARQHDIPVIFNFFAFTPPAWGGNNPYFDPRGLEAQKRFVGGFAGRLAGARDMMWDLINEPSFSSPARLWQCRPNYDADEQAAWETWLRAEVPAADDDARMKLLHERWNSVPSEGLSLPALADFGDRHLFGWTRPQKAADYRRFAQDAFGRWVAAMRDAIRASGAGTQLVTVGQDEGGTGERPNPVLFGSLVDFTCMHTWWNNDALLWDGHVSKRADRANVIEETGLMTYERPDGDAWRTEEEARNLLERKMALAFASDGAGFIEWLWNTNVYMPIDNEAGIGLLRADGSAKPELASLARMARFVHDHADRFAGRRPEDVAIVVPQSSILSVRDQGTPATQRAVRTLEYELRVPVRAVNEYVTADLRGGARLFVLPSPRILTNAAWESLMAAVDAGSTLLVTGPIDRDEHERPVARLANLGVDAMTRPVAPENRLLVDAATEISVPYRGGKLERIERGVIRGSAAKVVIIQRGKGKIVWCPLPVELSDDERATAAVYRVAMKAAGIRPTVTLSLPSAVRAKAAAAGMPGAAASGVLVRPLVFADSVLLVVVNETDRDADLRVGTSGLTQPVRIRVDAERAGLVLVDRRTGRVVDSTLDER